MHYKCSLLSSLPHSAFCSPAMQIVSHLLLLLVGIVEIAEFSLVNTNKKAEFNLINTNKKVDFNLVNTNKNTDFYLVNTNRKTEFNLVNTRNKAEPNMANTNNKAELNLVNTNPKATESLTSKCNLKLVKLGLTKTESRQILCLWNMKVLQKGTRVVIKIPSFFKLFSENAENRKLNTKPKDKYLSFKLIRVV